MKRKHSVCAIIMIVAVVGIILSCSNNPALENKLEETGYVSFGNANSRSLGVMYEMEDFDELYWTYTATKADGYGQTGQTSGEQPVPTKANGKGIGDGTVGPFSMGDWDFNLYAYKDAGKTIKLYESKTPSRVKINAGETKNISVAVSPYGTTGTLKIDNAYFNWDSTSGGDLPVIHLTLDSDKSVAGFDKEYSINPTVNESGDIVFVLNDTVPVGFYYCRLWASIETAETPIYETAEFTLRIYGATTTTIYGDITEQTGPMVKFSATKSDNSELAIITGTNISQVVVNATPRGDNTTTVDFGTYNVGRSSTTDDGNTTVVSHSLEVAVSSSDTVDTTDEERFIVDSGRDAVAALDLTLIKTTKVTDTEGNETITTEPVTTFGEGNEVTITTFIEKNLFDVKVKYNNGTDTPEEITPESYTRETGELVFKVSHFSEYYVVAKLPEARIGSVYYETLKNALDSALDGDVITILRDVTDAQGIAVGNGVDFTIDFGGHTYTLNKPGAGSTGTETNGFQLKKTSTKTPTITFKNGTINISEDNLTPIYGSDGKSRNIMRIIQNYSNLNLIDMTIDGTNQYGGAEYVMSFNNGTVNISGNTNITAAEGKVAFDADGNWGGYGRSIVNIDTTGTIVGNIEVGQGYLNLKNANVVGGIVLCTSCGDEETTNQKDRISVTGGTFSSNPSEYIGDYSFASNNGNGTYTVSTLPVDEDGTYLINDANGLVLFEKLVNERGNTFTDKTVKLTDNISLSGITWTPIGTNADGANKFQGTFDGQGHTISNMTVDQDDDVEYRAAGFFGALNGTAKNIIFDNATVTSISAPNGEGNTDNGTAVVAGSIYASGSIEGVTVNNSRVSGNRYVGGVSGYTYGSVKNCTVEDTTITSTPDNLTGSYDNGDKAGGVVGAFWHENNTHVISGNTVENVTVKGYRDIGGIVGYANGNVVSNTVNGLTLVQDYSVLTTPRTTVEAVVGRPEGFEVDASNTATDVIVRVDNVSTDTEFSASLKNKAQNIIVNLSGDVTYDVTPWIHGTGTMGGADTEAITINGNGNTITFNNTDSDANGIYIANENAVLTINNAKLTNSGYNDGPWNRHDICFYCKVVLNKVTSDKSIAVAKDSSLNNVDISDDRATDDYLLWIQAYGETVNLIECNLHNTKTTGTTRGVAIKDEYISAPVSVTLNVSGTTFVTTKKAAVLVTSTAGADITWGNGNDISDVVADSTNAVWNDADRTAAWDLVTVTGCTKFQET